MTRILSTLAGLSLILLIAALMVGLSIGDLYHEPNANTLHLATAHRLLGIAAALGVVFVESVIATYFIGTSRWCKEVSEAYGLEPELAGKSARLKRRNFPWSLISILVVIGVGALGAAADPATVRPGTESWVIVHLLGALAGFAFIALAFFIQGQRIVANHAVIEEIMAQVRRIREERGLEV